MRWEIFRSWGVLAFVLSGCPGGDAGDATASGAGDGTAANAKDQIDGGGSGEPSTSVAGSGTDGSGASMLTDGGAAGPGPMDGLGVRDAGGAQPTSDAGSAISVQACPLGTWSVELSGAGSCDGGAGKVGFVITQSANGELLVMQDLTNVMTGPLCDWEMGGTATYDGTTLVFDMVRDDNGCTKHARSTFTVDAGCKTISTDGDWTELNCESCSGPNGGCMGCGAVSCTQGYGPGTFTRE